MVADFFNLKGEAKDGMFPDEVTFVITGHTGETYVVMVPKEWIGSHDGTATIRVRAIDRDDDVVLVHVPGDSFDSSVVSVKSSELLPV